MKKTLLFVTLVFVYVSVMAQFSDPVHWTYSAKKISGKEYQLVFTATVDKPWHIYSQTTPKGGPVPTKFTYKTNPLVTMNGKTAKEEGDLKSEHDQYFGVDVKYFSDKVTFVQTVNLKSPVKTSVSGNIEFMVCNDNQCLPPKKVPFELTLQ